MQEIHYRQYRLVPFIIIVQGPDNDKEEEPTYMSGLLFLMGLVFRYHPSELSDILRVLSFRTATALRRLLFLE